jgi:uncharacterized Zn-binding protein involved in type VI secretion
MTINFVRLGDATDHGGVVITASQTSGYDGRGFARKGDLVTCPLHPEINPNPIIEGDETTTDHGIPISRQGHHALCGCSLISSLV